MNNPTFSANTNLAHYRIISKIGAGGMGEVYLAEDTRLDRKVALKILPADLAANHDRIRRFEHRNRPANVPQLYANQALHARHAAHARTFFLSNFVSIENKGSKV